MTLSERLSELVRACFSGLWVQSFEQDDAVLEIARLCRQQHWSLATWDIDRGLSIAGRDDSSNTAISAPDPLAAIKSIGSLATADGTATSQSGTQRRRRSTTAVPRKPVAPVTPMRLPARASAITGPVYHRRRPPWRCTAPGASGVVRMRRRSVACGRGSRRAHGSRSPQVSSSIQGRTVTVDASGSSGSRWTSSFSGSDGSPSACTTICTAGSVSP